MKMLNKLKSHLKIKNSKPNENIFFSDDVFIASFPKSGNTWTRFVLSHLFINCKHQLNFTNYDQYVPEPGLHDNYILDLKRPRLLKTHTLHSNEKKKAIYLIRDPRDVLVSYYFYLKKKLPKEYSIKDFIRDDRYSPNSWKNHVKSWENLENILIVRYEDLKKDPKKNFILIIDFIKEFNLDLDLLDKAMKMSSFNELKQQEDLHGRNFKNKEAENLSSTFMRKGESRDWVNHFDDEDLLYFETRIGKYMKKYNYI